MKDTFELGFAYLISKDEGSTYTNDPDDAGGPTKFGVTLKAYEAYVDRVVQATEIESLELGQAKDFFYAQYWKPMGCGRIGSQEVAIAAFDTGVLHGILGASLMIQRAAVNAGGGRLKFDGQIGDKSINAINTVKPTDLLLELVRLIHFRVDAIILKHPEDEKFRAGWLARANRLLTLKESIPLIE